MMRKKKKWSRAEVISSFAVTVSTVALALSILVNWTPGTIRLLSPAGYGIIRGILSDTGDHIMFPSDHIFLPTEWQNTNGHPVLVRFPYLLLRELSPDGTET